MRNPRNKRSDFKDGLYDLVELKPDESDCFGLLFDLSTSACSMCHDCDVCGVVYNHYDNKPKEASIKNKLIDRYNFDLARRSGLQEMLTKNPGVYTRESLFEAVVDITDCEEPNLINDFISSMLEELKMTVKNGIIIHRK